MTGRRQSVLDELKANYPKLHTIQSDVADPAQITALARRVKAEFPKLDVLMNNAGIMLHKNLSVPAADLDGLTNEIDINLGGVIRTTSAFIDILTANKGTLINVSSGLAFVPLSSAPIYCATKAAVHSYTQSLRFQLEESGVEVIELMPPAVKTAACVDSRRARAKSRAPSAGDTSEATAIAMPSPAIANSEATRRRIE